MDDPKATHPLDYWDGFASAVAMVVNDKRAAGWFSGKEDFLGYYRQQWNEEQSFTADVLYDIASLDEDFSA